MVSFIKLTIIHSVLSYIHLVLDFLLKFEKLAIDKR